MKVRNVNKINKSLFLVTPKLYVATFLLGLVTSMIPLMLGWIVKLIFDNLGIKEMGTFSLLIFFMLLLIVVQNILLYKLGLIETDIRFKASKSMITSFINRILLTGKNTKITASTALSIINNDFSFIEYKLCSIVELVNKISFFVVAFIIMSTINWRLALYAVLPLVLFNILIYFIRNKLKDRFVENRETTLTYQQFVHDVMSNMEAYKFLDEQNFLDNKLKSLGRTSLKTQLKQTLFSSIITMGIAFVNYLSIFIVLILAIFYLNNNELTIGDFTLFVSYISFGFAYLDLFAWVLNSEKKTEHVVSKIDDIVQSKELGSFNQLNIYDQEVGKEYHSNLVLNNFGISPNSKQYLNVTIPRGSLVIITGETGMGKSTFLNALLGQVEYSGQIIIDETIIADLSEYQTGIVPQRYNLFNLSLIDNVTLLSKTDEIQTALNIANINTDEIFNISEEQYLGVSGKLISEGQRQRVAISRGVYHGKEFLLMDDAFSYLDKKNRVEIFRKVLQIDATKFIVSNDLDVINAADYLLRINEGNIALIKG